jgi:hypothetical protein
MIRKKYIFWDKNEGKQAKRLKINGENKKYLRGDLFLPPFVDFTLLI